jgi:hypothetical protein
LRVVKRLARVPEEAVDLDVQRENVLATLAAAHAAQQVGLVALLVQLNRRTSQTPATPTRARIAAEFDLELQSWSMSGVALLPLGRQLLAEALESLHGPLVEANVDGVHARAGSARRGSSAPARRSA